MARVERGNVVLHIEDFDVPRYLSMGYNQTDDEGHILQASIPTSLNDLQAAYTQHVARIEELESTIAKLTAENQELRTKTERKTTKKKSEE